ncbi:hypothetical protein BUALT_Bualt18G0082200 [Buddleja alternifolia]|uniref:60S ribosomal protein L27 n=1 Tax=Buddleja alternifolia TaxID=168488 RepID=A0AAV6W950_9LAMI|nr:hypothetical protein BUALT_Bualt18G0082200 [Buddleja alternifolia]
MVKFLKPNKAVILLQGRFAGHKATIVKNFDDGTRDRAYGHCLVAGVAKYPSKVIRKDSAKKQAKKSRVKAFVKVVNYNHIMPTRYTLDVDLKDVVSPDALVSRDKKVTACKEIKARRRFATDLAAGLSLRAGIHGKTGKEQREKGRRVAKIVHQNGAGESLSHLVTRKVRNRSRNGRCKSRL